MATIGALSKYYAGLFNNCLRLCESTRFSESTAIEWQVGHEVTEEIIKVFARNEMTIIDVDKIAKSSRARITRILKRDTSDISLDVLLRVLGSTGQKVALKFSRAS
jgi:hypothetical protein